jgi:HlyD family secretion protein
MSARPVPQDDKLAQILAEGAQPHRRRRRGLAAAAVVGLGLAATVVGWNGGGTATPQFRTEPVRTGNLVVTVSASGNLQPTNEVEVGSEVSGLVEGVFVDDNDHVSTGQVLARLDVSKLQDQVVNARAALAAAEARVQQAEASVKESQANLSRLRQVAELSNGKVPSKVELEAAEASAQRAVADEASARAAVEQAQASLSSAEINLSKASIRSPINGIVLARQVEPGQTVAASFQAPVLFTLAEDLSQMELQVDVDEADVGRVRAGLPATFTVDAYSDRRYPARITRVNYGSETKDGVVSYTTVLSVDNTDLSLRPGMTATAEITTVELTDVLLVPNAALRFSPPAPISGASEDRSVVSRLLPRPPRPSGRTRGAAIGSNGTSHARQVFVLRDGQPTAVPVTVGPSDGRLTQVTGEELQPGMAVITESIGARS